jgi:DNA-binding CsgD family transcriptional regulator
VSGKAWPLAGRADELALIEELLGRPAAAGVVLAGAPGVGKTRLATEALEQARARGFATRWATATRSTAVIPFGAFAHLLPATTGRAHESPLELMRDLVDALADQAAGKRLVFGVDDAHLLDPASAALVHQLAIAGIGSLVLTVRSGEPGPDPIVALWKDGLAEYFEVQALSEREVELLLETVLDGAVDGATRLRLWQLTRGNVLLLRELVLGGLESGRLANEGGVWRGSPAASGRLAEIVQLRLGELTRDERELLELVAAGEPLGLGVFERITSAAALDALERRGLLAVELDQRRAQLRLGHPLFGELLRADAPTLASRVVYRRLAEALEATGSRRRGDPLRAAMWRLEGGVASEPELLVAAAGRALSAFDAALAERFARAGSELGGGFAAAHLLAAAIAGQGRFDEAEAQFAAIEPATEQARTMLAHARAMNLFFGLGQAAGAENVALAAEKQIHDRELRDELASLRAVVWLFSGRPLDALAAATPILERADVGDRVAIHAALAAEPAYAATGRAGEAIALAGRWRDAALRLGDQLPMAATRLECGHVLALWLAGRLDESQVVADRGYRLALEERGHEASAMWAMILGAVWLSRGRLRTSTRWLRESAALFREFDPTGHLPWSLAFLAQALALAGDPVAAAAALTEADASQRPGIRIFNTTTCGARAWIAAARGEFGRAGAITLEAADAAEASGMLAFAVLAANDLARLGEAELAAPRLSALAASVDGPLAPVCAAAAAARAARNGVALDESAHQFERLGFDLLAAEAAAAAAAAHRANGRSSSAWVSTTRARLLIERCEGAVPPAIAASSDQDVLTRREHEVAALAAAGHSNREIAARLVLSVRTVENHLQRVYAKLAISDRGELHAAVSGPEDDGNS